MGKVAFFKNKSTKVAFSTKRVKKSRTKYLRPVIEKKLKVKQREIVILY